MWERLWERLATGLPNDPALWPAWAKVDNSKLEAWRRCPREYFIAHVLGWISRLPNVHLTVGRAWHAAMEVRGGGGSADEAWAAFLREYQSVYGLTDPGDSKRKSLEAMRTALFAYVAKYPLEREPWKALHLEAPVRLELGEARRPFWGKLDKVVEWGTGMMSVVDFKTTAWNNTAVWRAQWELFPQMQGYLYWLAAWGGVDRCQSAIVDVVFLREKLPTFERVEVGFARQRVAEWEASVVADLETIEERLAQAGCERSADAFPCNGFGCVRYNNMCPFHGICTGSGSPLAMPGRPQEFVEGWWEPEKGVNVDDKGAVVERKLEAGAGFGWMTAGAQAPAQGSRVLPLGPEPGSAREG